jgi:uncharacterized protein (TIGR02118 family)
VIKIVFSWKDHPDKTAEECDAHYRAVHMDLARRAFDGVDGFRALAYNRVNSHFVNDHNRPEPLERPTDMDAFVELYFDSREQLQQAFGTPELAALFADHPNFMEVDVAANIRGYDVEEVVFFGERPEHAGA